MARFNGQVHVRVSPELHEEVATEAFEKGTSISGIFTQALVVRQALQNTDPWKAIEGVWKKNQKVDEAKLQSDINKAIKAVRKKRE